MQSRDTEQEDLNIKLSEAIIHHDEQAVYSLLSLGANPIDCVIGDGRSSSFSVEYNKGDVGKRIIIACYIKILDDFINNRKALLDNKKRKNSVADNSIPAAEILKAVLRKEKTVDNLAPYFGTIIIEGTILCRVYKKMVNLGVFTDIFHLNFSRRIKESVAPAIPSMILSTIKKYDKQPELAQTASTIAEPELAQTVSAVAVTGLAQAVSAVAEPKLGLSDLPENMLNEIMNYLSLKDMIQLRKVNKLFNSAAKSNDVWKIRVQRYFPIDFKNLKNNELLVAKYSVTFNWMSAFIMLYIDARRRLSFSQKKIFDVMNSNDVSSFLNRKKAEKFISYMEGSIYSVSKDVVQMNLAINQSSDIFDRHYKNCLVVFNKTPDRLHPLFILRSAIISNQPLDVIQGWIDKSKGNLHDDFKNELYLAIKLNRKEAVQLLLKENRIRASLVGAEKVEWIGGIFFSAVESGSLSLFKFLEDEIKFLLRRPNQEDKSQEELSTLLAGIKNTKMMSLLKSAAFSGNLEIVQHLVESHRMSVDMVDSNNVSLLEWVLEVNNFFSHTSIIMYLLGKINLRSAVYKTRYLVLLEKINADCPFGEDGFLSLTDREDLPFFFAWLNHYNAYFVHRAVANNNKHVLGVLLKKNFPFKTILDKYGCSLLHVAAAANHVHLIKFLINIGISIEGVDLYGDTPLHHATKHGAKDAIDFLLAAGANKRAINKSGLTPLYMAAFRGNNEQVNALWFDDAKNQLTLGKSVLCAAVEGYIEAIKTNGSRFSVSHCLSLPVKVGDAQASMDVINNLIEKQVDPNDFDQSKEEISPLFLASTSKDDGLVKKLLDAGASVSPSVINSMIMRRDGQECVSNLGSQDILKLLLIKQLNHFINDPQEPQNKKLKIRSEDLQTRRQRCVELANKLIALLNGSDIGNIPWQSQYGDIIEGANSDTVLSRAVRLLHIYGVLTLTKSNNTVKAKRSRNNVTSVAPTLSLIPPPPPMAMTSTSTSINTHPPMGYPIFVPALFGAVSAISGVPAPLMFFSAAATATSLAAAPPPPAATPLASQPAAATPRVSGLQPAESRSGLFQPSGRVGGLSLPGRQSVVTRYSDPDASESSDDDTDDERQRPTKKTTPR